MLFHSIAWTARPSASPGLGGRPRGHSLRMTLKTWLRNGRGYQDPPHKAPRHSANARPHMQPTEPTAQLLPPKLLMLLLGLGRLPLVPQVQTSPRQPSAHWDSAEPGAPLRARHHSALETPQEAIGSGRRGVAHGHSSGHEQADIPGDGPRLGRCFRGGPCRRGGPHVATRHPGPCPATAC